MGPVEDFHSQSLVQATMVRPGSDFVSETIVTVQGKLAVVVGCNLGSPENTEPVEIVLAIDAGVATVATVAADAAVDCFVAFRFDLAPIGSEGLKMILKTFAGCHLLAAAASSLARSH